MENEKRNACANTDFQLSFIVLYYEILHAQPTLTKMIMAIVFIKINTLSKIMNTTLWLLTSASDRRNLKLVFVADITQALIG